MVPAEKSFVIETVSLPGLMDVFLKAWATCVISNRDYYHFAVGWPCALEQP
jgi:hypothetical protein